MHVTLRQLRALVAVAETGSFTDAAKTLHLSQAALSGLVKDLEAQVDVRLLDRNTRKVAPSAVGNAFIPLVVRALADIDEALDGLRDLKDLRRGLVRVAAPESVSCTYMPRLIADYRRRHPGVEVRFDDISIERVIQGLEDGSLDIGFGPRREVDEELVSSKTLWSDPLWAAVRHDDELAGRPHLSWTDLRNKPVFSYIRSFKESVLSQVAPEDRPVVAHQVHRVNTALSMLQVEPGAAICPSLVRTLADGFGLKFLPLVEPVVERDIAVYFRRRESLSPAVASFLAFSDDFSGRWLQSMRPPKPEESPAKRRRGRPAR